MYLKMEEYYLHGKYILTDRTIVQSQAPEPISNSEAKRRHAPLVPRWEITRESGVSYFLFFFLERNIRVIVYINRTPFCVDYSEWCYSTEIVRILP